MSATPTEEQIQNQSDPAVQESAPDQATAVETPEEAFEAEDLSIPEDVPTADDPSSRADRSNLDEAGFTLDEFSALLSKYDCNF